MRKLVEVMGVVRDETGRSCTLILHVKSGGPTEAKELLGWAGQHMTEPAPVELEPTESFEGWSVHDAAGAIRTLKTLAHQHGIDHRMHPSNPAQALADRINTPKESPAEVRERDVDACSGGRR